MEPLPASQDALRFELRFAAAAAAAAAQNDADASRSPPSSTEGGGRSLSLLSRRLRSFFFFFLFLLPRDALLSCSTVASRDTHRSHKLRRADFAYTPNDQSIKPVKIL